MYSPGPPGHPGNREGTLLSDTKVKRLLAELEEEVASNDGADRQTRELIAALNARLNRADDEDEESLSNTARELESRFAANHPVAERIAREIADLLSKMGI